MQKDTKKLIYDTFIELLTNKSFDKITVRDIVETCGINRNTFYYYYCDIYDLLEEVFKKELNILTESHKTGVSWITAFIKVANTAHSHKKIINNICSSRSYDYLENYMHRACKNILIEVVKREAEGIDLPEEDIEFIATYHLYALVGVISEWFRTGMREDPIHFASQLWLVLDGIKFALRKSRKRQINRIENEDFD